MHHVQNMKQSFLSLGHSTVRIVVEAVRVSGPMTSSEFDSKHVYVQIENASALTEALEAKDPCLVFSVSYALVRLWWRCYKFSSR